MSKLRKWNLPRMQRENVGRERRRTRHRLRMECLESRRLLTVIVVNTPDDVVDPNDDLISLREAVATANTTTGAQEITFDPALTVDNPIIIQLTEGEIEISDSVTIRGPEFESGGVPLVTVDAEDLSRVFNIPSGNADVTLGGLTIANGDTTGSGGGISFVSTGTLTIEDSVIRDSNASDEGGGIYSAGDLVVRDSTVSGNLSGVEGGGIRGSIELGFPTVNVSRSAIVDNTSRFGGGISADNVIISNSTLGDNTATALGGGVFSFNGSVNIDHSTVTRNHSEENSGGLHFGFTTPVIHNTIVALNTSNSGAVDVSGTLDASSSYNLIGDGTGLSGIADADSGNQIGTSAEPIDPGFQTFSSSQTIYPLAAGSPAVNAGDPGFDGTGLSDQRGVPFDRVVDGRLDIGAFELTIEEEEEEEGAVRRVTGFTTTALTANDDLSSAAIPIGFDVDFFGDTHSELFVNNNGNVTFGSAFGDSTPISLADLNSQIIAPFFADVDTRAAGSGVVTYGTDTIDGRAAFGVNWNDVGFFFENDSLLNRFQLVMIDRSDVAAGAFDLEFNYDTINWETADFDGGVNGLGGSAARVGFTDGSGIAGNSFEPQGSGENGALLNDNPTTGLAVNTFDSATPGRYVYEFRGGTFTNNNVRLNNGSLEIETPDNGGGISHGISPEGSHVLLTSVDLVVGPGVTNETDDRYVTLDSITDEIRFHGGPMNATLAIGLTGEHGLVLDGGGGENILKFNGGRGPLDLTAPSVSVTNFQTLELGDDPFTASLTLDTATVAALSPTTRRVAISAGQSDQIMFADESNWELGDPIANGRFIRPIVNTVSGDVVDIDSPNAWQNAINVNDVDNNGEFEAADVLTIINELVQSRFSDIDTGVFVDPLSVAAWPHLYFDSSGDGLIRPMDVLLVINELARRVTSDPGEPEAFLSDIIIARSEPAGAEAEAQAQPATAAVTSGRLSQPRDHVFASNTPIVDPADALVISSGDAQSDGSSTVDTVDQLLSDADFLSLLV